MQVDRHNCCGFTCYFLANIYTELFQIENCFCASIAFPWRPATFSMSYMVGREDKRTNNRTLFPAVKKKNSAAAGYNRENRAFERFRTTASDSGKRRDASEYKSEETGERIAPFSQSLLDVL